MFQEKVKVLLFEDNPGDVLLIREMFKEEVASRLELASVAELADGIKRLSEQEFDAVLLDLNLPDSIGIATARRLKQNAPNLPIVILTSLAEEAIALEAIQLGMEDYLVKGQITGALLTHALRYAIERKRVERALRESEEKMRSLFENSPDIIAIMDREGKLLFANRARTMAVEETLGTCCYDYVSPEYRQAYVDTAERVFQTGIPYTIQTRDIGPEGRTSWSETRFVPLESGDSEQMLMLIATDITGRKEAEEALRKSEQKLRLMFEAIEDGIFVVSLDGKVMDVNDGLEKITGFGREQLIGQSGLDYMFPGFGDDAMGMLQKAVSRGGIIKAGDLLMKTAAGKTIDVEASASILSDIEGNPIGLIGILRDVSERKRSEEALRNSEEKLRVTFDSMMDGIVVSDPNIKIVDVNKAVVKMLGVKTREELIGRSAADVIRFKNPEDAMSNLVKMLQEQRTQEKVEYSIVLTGGKEMEVEVSTAMMHDNAGNIGGFVSAIRDITERKKMEETILRISKAVESSSDAIAMYDAQGHHFYHNKAFADLFEYTPEELEAAGGGPATFADKEVAREVFGAIMGGGSWRGEVEMVAKSGRKLTVFERADAIKDEARNVVGLVGIHTDITERRKTEEQIRHHAKRIEALYAIVQVITQSSTIDAMLGEALDKVRDAMDIESVCIFMLDYDDRALKLKAYKGLPESIVPKVSTIMMTEQGIERLINLTEPIITIDETQDVIDTDKIREVVTELGRKAIVAAPLFLGGELRGLIIAFTIQERTFSHDDLEMLTAMANEIAVGINNIMLLERTRELSVTDELTALYNRRHFFAMLDVEMNRASRTKRPFCLVMLDLDGFKEYNDKFGHVNGDAALQSFSQMIKASIRKSDMAFRYGGDEFALILPTADAEKAKEIIRRARSIWQKSPMIQSSVFGGHVEFSTGIAEYPANAESADGLVFLSDAALYQAKRNGGHDDKLVSELSTLSTGVLDMATQDQVYALAATVDARDPYTYGHSQRVAEIARLIGRAIGMTEEDLAKVHAAALLHDIGKVGIPDSILAKMGEPTKEEWHVIKRHSAEGARIVSYVKELASIVPIILHHHEWYDGTGYPDGLKGIDIPVGARITSIADAYDTMVTKRPYRNVVSPKKACKELRQYAGTQFDPALVDVWCKLVEEAEQKK